MMRLAQVVHLSTVRITRPTGDLAGYCTWLVVGPDTGKT